MKKWYWFALLAVGAALIVSEVLVLRHNKTSQPAAEPITQAEQSKEVPAATVVDKPKEIVLPDSFMVSMPFTSQAPFANWDQFHEEACEEASLLMVRAAKQGKILGDPTSVDRELRRLVDWETAQGYGEDITLKQLQEIAVAFYGLRGGQIVDNPTPAQIKEFIAKGSLVVVPAAGRVLPNPYFTPPGPNYHMLVIRGYTSTHFITNDPGTKRGEKLAYTYTDLLQSTHDFVSGDITKGKQRVLVY